MATREIWSDDTQDLRRALGRFPTGVAIVTTRDERKESVGMTINSFSSVSLSPPLIAWCIDNTAASYHVFARAQTFAITVLANDQSALAIRFATRGQDKFRGMNTTGTEDPLVPGGCAWFRCRTYRSYALGDHRMLLGQVTVHGRNLKQPLLFQGGKFQQIDAVNALDAA